MNVEQRDLVGISVEVIRETLRQGIDLIQLSLFRVVLGHACVPSVLDHPRSLAAPAVVS